MRRLVWCVSLVSLVAACGSSGTTRAGDTTSTSVRITPAGVLRGVPARKFDCSHPAVSSGVRPVPIEGVHAFLLCPLGAPGQSSKTVTVGAKDPAFEVLVRALSAADLPPTRGAVCPAYADLSQLVLAKTTGGAYQVSIPTDACMHYQHAALDALSRARGA
jgi:hypothetical protein